MLAVPPEGEKFIPGPYAKVYADAEENLHKPSIGAEASLL
jgi:hypothetical protein